MRNTALFALICSSVAAQVTSPAGYGATEGNATFFHWSGSRRFQQVDQSQAGTPFAISSISWRRDGNTAAATWSRTFDLKIDLGACDFAVVSHLLDNNHLPGSRTTVFNAQINFPDWSLATPGPAPFDLTATFTVPYVYLAQNALVIDFEHTNNTSTGTLATDRQFNGATSPTAGTVLGTGCIAGGNTAAFSHTTGSSNLSALPTPAYGLRVRFGGANAPATGGVLCFIDVADQNLSGILCSTLHAGPLVSLPMTSLPTGQVPDLSLGFSHQNSLIGQVLYSQLVAPDLSQTPLPAVVSNARVTTITSTTFSGAERCAYGWYTIPSTTGIATMFFGGGMVMQLQ